MGAKRTTLIFLPFLLAGRFACADNAGLVAPPPLTGQNAPSRPVSHIDYLSNRFLAIKEKSAMAEPTFRNDVVNAKSESTPTRSSPSTGLRLRVDDQHPGLEYRFSNDATIHFHIARHGTSMTAGWHF